MLQNIQVHSKQCQPLIHVVMELSRNPAALLLVSFDEPAAHGRQRFFCLFAFGDIKARSDITGKGTLRIEARYPEIEDPAVYSIMPAKTILHLERFALIKCLRI